MPKKEDRKKKQKHYLRLRRNRTGGIALLYFFLLCCAVFIVMLFTEIFTMFVVNSGIEREYEAKQVLAQLYEEDADSDDPYHVFDTAGMTYLIKDNAGNVLHLQGENTCSEQGGSMLMTLESSLFHFQVNTSAGSSKQIMIYADTEKPLVRPDGEDDMVFDLRRFMVEAWKTMNTDAKTDTDKIRLPLWEAVSMKNGTETLLFKAYILLSQSNVILVFVLLGILAAMLLIVLILMIAHAISNGINQRRINKLFFTDIRTKGRNWMWFLLHAEQKLRQPFSARRDYAMVDLEFVDYRRFCICHSVDEGAVMLGSIYKKLRELLHRRELCAICGEDTFSLLLIGSGEDLKERMKAILAELGRIGGEHGFTYHAGIYPLPPEEKPGLFARRREADVDADFHNAVAACVSVEGLPGSRVALYDEKLIEEQRWVDTVQEMQQRAVDNEEFVVYYQPKYDPRTHELRGAEALIRWQSPEYGFLPPYKFIPIFEENGFITEIDHYMLRHVARAQRYWLDEGQHCVPISVNVSRAHFIESDLAEQIRDMIDREHVPHNLIEIEVTESAFFDDKKAMINTIIKLKEYGFAVSMDDFGAGYSSLNSLKDMPLDVLKLDADFFRGVAAESDRGEIIVSETIRLAKSLRMRTVAEGIEIKDQVEFLADQGCDMIQGYYFARPMPADDYRDRMIQGRSDGQEEGKAS